MSTTHIAGFPVRIGRKGRQRCAWCGEMLFEVTGHEMSPARPDGMPEVQSRPWEVGRLVEVTKDGPVTGYVLIPHVDGDELPANACVGPPKLRAIAGGLDGHRHP
jgi:hypothetical protein